MTAVKSYLEGKRILVVDDEPDIIETVAELLSEAEIDSARNYPDASLKIHRKKYDLALLDIMGVDGLTLLDESVARGIPTVMLTAHAMNPETLMASIRAGAVSYLPKEALADLGELLESLLGAHERGEPVWKMLFDKLGAYFDQRFGPGWKKKNEAFWTEFDRAHLIGKGIQKRLMGEDRIRDKLI
jgi:CheY-like chemotaxis protein